MKDNMSDINTKTNMLVAKDNLSYNINKRLKEKELTSLSMCEDGDKCYLFTYSDSTTDKLVYNTDSITFNNYTFEITDGITVEAPTITEHYDTMTSTAYNGYIIINIPITINNKDYSIKTVKHINADSVMVDLYQYDNNGNMYTIVNYIESTGTQYINTGINTNSGITDQSFVIQVIHKNVRQLNGAPNGWWWGVTSSNYYDGAGTIDVKPSIDSFDNIQYITDYPNITRTMVINGKSFSQTYDQMYYSLGSNIFLFGISNFGQLYNVTAIIKKYTISVDGFLVRDYIPVLDSSSRPCLFDKVSKTCFYNQGEGEFLYG